jgi:hypothetical protein
MPLSAPPSILAAFTTIKTPSPSRRDPPSTHTSHLLLGPLHRLRLVGPHSIVPCLISILARGPRRTRHPRRQVLFVTMQRPMAPIGASHPSDLLIAVWTALLGAPSRSHAVEQRFGPLIQPSSALIRPLRNTVQRLSPRSSDRLGAS